MDEAALHALMVRALGGDGEAYTALLRCVADRLRSYFRRRLFQQPDEAEDLVQEVLLAIHAKRGTFDQRQPLTAWVYAIARFKLVDSLRRSKRRGISVPVDDADGLFGAEPDHGAGHDVERLLDHLPEKQREAIRMVKLEELSVSEAAKKGQMSESDVKVSVHRGLKKLTKIVKDET
jgi:RNA polymerase sigma-70 factor (ECF subfamily)